MSEPGSVEPEKTVPAKKPISPARNIMGLVVLAAAVVVGVLEYSAYFGHRWAAAALKARVEDQEKDLMTLEEAETLLGKSADAPAVDDKDNPYGFSKKTYTWRGLLKQYSLTAYYTKEKQPHLTQYETGGDRIERPAPTSTGAPVARKKGSGGAGTKGGSGKTGGKTGSAPQAKVPTDSKTEKPATSDKPADSQPGATDKSAAPKPAPPGDAATKDQPVAPSDKDSTAKPAGDPPTAKPAQ